MARSVKLLAYLALICALLGCSSLTQLDSNAGRITFGRSVDMTTFTLTGEGGSFPVGQDVAYRASLSKVMGPGSIRLSGTLNRTVILDSTNQVSENGWSLYVGTLPGSLLFEGGTFQMRVLDVGNNELASGSFTVSS